MKTKRWLLLLLTLALIFSACQTTDAPATDPAADETVTEAAQDTAASAPVPGSTDAVNAWLNDSADLGEGSIANPVAVIPIAHIDGPGNESDFYAFVNFKYMARDFIKYQISYVSCTCREASVNYWQTAYVEMTLPESRDANDAVIQTVSFDKDGTGNYTAGHWGDSDPIPNGTTYEQIKTEFIPYFTGKTLGEISGISTVKDIDTAAYQEGDRRSAYTIDTFSGATVSTNNIIRMLTALGSYHATDAYFGGEAVAVPAGTAETAEVTEGTATEPAAAGPASEAPAKDAAVLPAPIDTSKSFKATKDATEDTPCGEGSFAADCSAVNSSNLIDYMNRDDVLYIDTRDFEDYVKKHFRNFEAVPFFAYVFNAEAHTNTDLIQLYGGTPADPVPVYEESDKILEYLFPKDKTLFIMCQSGGRVKMLMEIMEARGWDMTKVYNIGGMAQYTGAEYRDLITDTPELTITGGYSFEGLTRIAP